MLGSFWAHGDSAQALDDLPQTSGPLTVFDFPLWADRGWIHGQRLQDYVNKGLNDSNIGDMTRNFIAMATRLQDKESVFFNSGKVGVVVRASSAVHRIFSPVGIHSVEYEDGDKSLPVAVRAARQAGDPFVIAVDVTTRTGSSPADTSATRLERESHRRVRIDSELEHADVVIHPDMGFCHPPHTCFFPNGQAVGREGGPAAFGATESGAAKVAKVLIPKPNLLHFWTPSYHPSFQACACPRQSRPLLVDPTR